MKKIAGGLLLIVVLIGGLALAGVVPSSSYSSVVISGYDGPTAEISRVEHEYPSAYFPSVSNTGTAAEVVPGPVLGAPSGIRAEIQGMPNLLSKENIETIDLEQGSVAVQKVKAEMALSMETFKGGTDGIYETTFVIHLQENDYSFFSDSDAAMSYIVNVYTTDEAAISGDFEPRPSSGGYDFPLESVGEHTVPDWVQEAGYGQSSLFHEVEFAVTALEADPGDIVGLFRTDASATLKIGMDIWLFGHWEQTKDYRDWDWPEEEGLFAQLLAFLETAGWLLVGGIVMVAVLYFAPGKWKLVGVIVFVGIALWQFGILDSIFARLGLG
jgi:hypothetical protein